MKTALCLGLVFLLCSSAFASADATIQRGIDVFTTLDDGNTFYSFAKNPIPAGFFCPGSASFAGTVNLKGLPLETDPPGRLRGTDTVIERLDDAAFDGNGNAATRIRFRALSLVSSKPIQTACGPFHIYVSLNGEQRTTIMRIYQTRPEGGTFVAPLAVDARMVFVPAGGQNSKRLEMTGSFTFPAQSLPWSFQGGPGAKKIGPVNVDTNADRVADTNLLGTSNFAPGWIPGETRAIGCTYPKRMCEPQTCHTDPATGEQHCSGPICVCSTCQCP